uniref:SAP domain-containing protein n=1 Tax=Cercocebus atys TaxID=9531 RepID=A0A2K5LK51_CERAT
MVTEMVELHKLKLTKGIKQDLIHRLQAYLEEHANEDVLGDETEEETNPLSKRKNPLKKTVDVAAEKKVRMRKRAERFSVRVSLESKKATWAARLGISSVPTQNKPTVNVDKSKERAQRFGLGRAFGLNVSSISRKSEDDKKLKKRKERFGIVTSSAGTGTTEDKEVEKRKRAERFGTA